MYSDKTLTCRDCGQSFVFTAGEQDFHAQKGFTKEPGRCPECRRAHKAQGGGRSDRGFGGAREMHTTTCSSCGRECQVPFKPSGERPVYCSDCFQNQRGGSSSSYSSSRW